MKETGDSFRMYKIHTDHALLNLYYCCQHQSSLFTAHVNWFSIVIKTVKRGYACWFCVHVTQRCSKFYFLSMTSKDFVWMTRLKANKLLRLQNHRLEIAYNVAIRGTTLNSFSILHKNTGGNAQSISCEYSGYQHMFKLL